MRLGQNHQLAVWLLLLLVWINSPADVRPGETLGCKPPAVSTEGWKKVGGSAFTVLLPKEFEAKKIQPIDSEVGEWSDAVRRVSYDYGMYSDPLSGINLTDLEICEEQVGGRDARIVTYSTTESGYVAAAHWANLEHKLLAGRTVSLGLTIYARSPDRKGQVELLTALRSVRFKQ